MAKFDKIPYQILDVSKDIDNTLLRVAFRNKIHDHINKKISPIQFKRVCRAYETLSDFDKRKHYDTTKEWISELPLEKYTPQQLAAEPDLIRDFEERIRGLKLTQLNAQDPNTGQTILYTAARSGNVAAVRLLTEQGADPDLPQRTGSTALHAASFFGHGDVVRCLLECGASYKILNSSDNTPEGEAYAGEITEEFNRLKENAYVRAAANELDWFYENELKQHQDTEYFSQRQTLLHCASKKGYFELVRWLVENKSANFDLIDFNGNSALHLAAFSGHDEIVDYLLNRGCDPTLRNRWGTTAEEEGSKHGRKITDIFQHMRDRDMFEMARNGVAWWFYYYYGDRSKDAADSNGISLLYYACRNGHYSVAKWLLKHGANVNIQMEGTPKSTPLHGAKYRGHWKIVELLLEYGADINIKNEFGKTIYEEMIHEEVNKDSSNKIRDILLQYQLNLRGERVVDIHLFDEKGIDDVPTVKIKLQVTAKEQDLVSAASNMSEEKYSYFSIARRLLVFETNETTVISAVVNARYAYSKFIDTPICLVCHKTLPKAYSREKAKHEEQHIDIQSFTDKFDKYQTTTKFTLNGPFHDKQEKCTNDLVLTFPENSTDCDIGFSVKTIFSPDFDVFGIFGGICLFETEIGTRDQNFSELPTVFLRGHSDVYLYTLAKPSTYWFGSRTIRTQPTQLPMMGGIHVFVRHVDVISGRLNLPSDMFIAASLGQPLVQRNKPLPCKYLHIREHDRVKFPHKAYHGTNVESLRSILVDGLVMPGTVTSSGNRINPPRYHIARGRSASGISDYAGAIFLSPSIHYCSDPAYAIAFIIDDQRLIPILKCSVKSKSYTTHKSTVPTYKKHSDDDMDTIEWRVLDPADIEINGVIFITKSTSVTSVRTNRICQIS